MVLNWNKPDCTVFVLLCSMFDEAVDIDTEDEVASVGDLISLLIIDECVIIVLSCFCCWTDAFGGILFDVVTSDTWHGSRLICDTNFKGN